MSFIWGIREKNRESACVCAYVCVPQEKIADIKENANNELRKEKTQGKSKKERKKERKRNGTRNRDQRA